MKQRSLRVESPVGRIYTTKEVAVILKTSQRMVQWLIQHQRLKAFQVSHSYRVLESQLQAFCAADRPTSPEPHV